MLFQDVSSVSIWNIKWPDQVKLSFRDELRAVPKDFISNPSSPNSPLKTLSPPSKQLPFGEGSRHTHLGLSTVINDAREHHDNVSTDGLLRRYDGMGILITVTLLAAPSWSCGGTAASAKCEVLNVGNKKFNATSLLYETHKDKTAFLRYRFFSVSFFVTQG